MSVKFLVFAIDGETLPYSNMKNPFKPEVAKIVNVPKEVYDTWEYCSETDFANFSKGLETLCRNAFEEAIKI